MMPSLSRITTVLKGDDSALDLCISQLRKLINVVDVTDFKEGQAVSRELVLVRIKADGKTRPEIMQICDIFRAKIVNVAHRTSSSRSPVTRGRSGHSSASSSPSASSNSRARAFSHSSASPKISRNGREIFGPRADFVCPLLTALNRIILATRKSPLALAQAELVAARLRAHFPGAECALLKVVTTGDRKAGWSLEKQGGKGLFTAELEQALLGGEADVAVHSSKDLPNELARGLVIAGYLPREDPRDVLVVRARRRGAADHRHRQPATAAADQPAVSGTRPSPRSAATWTPA